MHGLQQQVALLATEVAKRDHAINAGNQAYNAAQQHIADLQRQLDVQGAAGVATSKALAELQHEKAEAVEPPFCWPNPRPPPPRK